MKTNKFGVTLMALLALAPAIKADDCLVVLKPYFDWAGQSQGGNIYPVYVTLTKHSSSLSTIFQSFAAPVTYAYGELNSKVGWLPNLGSTGVYTTGQKYTGPPEQKNAGFVLGTSSTLELFVWQLGLVSVQEKVQGTLVGAPTVFNAACQSDGLMTAIVNHDAYTVTLKNGSHYSIPQ